MSSIFPAENLIAAETPDIGLSDVLIALKYLAPESDEIRKKIVETLGFKWEYTKFSLEESEDEIFHQRFSQTKNIEEERAKPPIEVLEDKPISKPEILEPVYIEEVKSSEREVFLELETEASEALPATNIELHFGKPQYIPLFNQRWFQGIASSMLATHQLSTNIDFEFIEKCISTLSPLGHLPYLYRSTLNKGVQVLLDISESMQPFWRDQAMLLTSLKNLFGAHRTQLFEFVFEYRPFQQLVWRAGAPEQLQAEIPILMVTNFGSTIDARLNRIEENKSLLLLLEQAKIKKCEVIALIPTSEDMCPKDIKDLIPLSFIWDRETSPQTVYKLMRQYKSNIN